MRCRREAPVAVRGAMGLVYVAMGVAREGGPEQTVRFLIDSGAAYSVLPWRVWRALGLKPKRRLEFTLADGTIIRRRRRRGGCARRGPPPPRAPRRGAPPGAPAARSHPRPGPRPAAATRRAGSPPRRPARARRWRARWPRRARGTVAGPRGPVPRPPRGTRPRRRGARSRWAGPARPRLRQREQLELHLGHAAAEARQLDAPRAVDE